jgi:hypothetical protein
MLRLGTLLAFIAFAVFASASPFLIKVRGEEPPTLTEWKNTFPTSHHHKHNYHKHCKANEDTVMTTAKPTTTSSSPSTQPSIYSAAPSSSQSALPTPLHTYVPAPQGPCGCCAPINVGTPLFDTSFNSTTTTEAYSFLQCELLCDGIPASVFTDQSSTRV